MQQRWFENRLGRNKGPLWASQGSQEFESRKSRGAASIGVTTTTADGGATSSELHSGVSPCTAPEHRWGTSVRDPYSSGLVQLMAC